MSPHRLAPALLAGLLAACAADADEARAPFPSTVVVHEVDTLRLGHPLPGPAPARVRTYADLDRPDGVRHLYAEVDSLGIATSFEFWYAPDTRYADVLRYYTRVLGAPGEQFERLVGACSVWTEGDYAFQLCRSRAPGEHGEVIAHVRSSDRF